MVKIPATLNKLAKSFPCPLYIVGGFVRNSLDSGKETDIDLCGGAVLGANDSCAEYKIIPVNPRLGTVIICIDGARYEYTPFRSEQYPTGGAHSPSSVIFGGDIYEDSLRRDFTVNAIYYDIKENKLIDFHGGIADIKAKVIRAVPDPERVFSSDGLRIMRLIRQSAEMGYTIDTATLNAARALSHLLKDISKERIRIELDKILVADRYGVFDAHYVGLKLIGTLGAWHYIIPEITSTQGVEQNPKYHKYDVYEHSLQCARLAPPHIRLAALLHDIGKPLSIERTGKMHEHAPLGAELAKKILGQNGLKYPNEIIDRTARLIGEHMYNRDGKTRRNKLRRFVAKNRDILFDLIELIKADAAAKGFDGTDQYQPPNYMQFVDTLNDMKTNGIPFSVTELKINGKDLINLGIKGERIGQTLEMLFDGCICSHFDNEREALLREAMRLTIS